MIDFFLPHSRFTEPGAQAGWLDPVPGGLASLRSAASGLVFHYWAHGDITRHGFAPERLAEIDLRYAADMFARLRELNPAPPGRPRAETERIVGCCRDFTLLFIAMARHHGIPARMRVGFASYLVPGWYLDHVVAEVWDAAERRWRLVEPQFPGPAHTDPVDGAELDLLDIPRDRFLVGADAWTALRGGEADPEKFVVAPEIPKPFLRGLPYARHNLVFDLAALNKHEMILWDVWGGLGVDPEVSPEQAARADELAELLGDPDVRLEQLQVAFEADDVRVPPVIRSVTPPGEVVREVVLR